MKQLKNSVRVLGLFTIIAGAALHFLFEWCRNSPLAALIAPVNESVWEHEKLLFYPFLAGACVLYLCFKKPSWIPFSAAAGLLTGMLSIPFLYYTYTGALGLQADWFNIVIFIISVFITCTVFYLLALAEFSPRPAKWIGICLLLFLILLLTWFTFAPPELPLFQDPVTGTYGYLKK